MRKTDSGFFISCGDDSRPRRVTPSEEHKGDRFFIKHPCAEPREEQRKRR